MPLAGGFLSGKCERADPDDPEAVEASDGTRGGFDDYYLSERGWHVLNEIRSIAEEVGATPAQVSLRWVTDWDEFTCVPILGPLQSVNLTRALWQQVSTSPTGSGIGLWTLDMIRIATSGGTDPNTRSCYPFGSNCQDHFINKILVSGLAPMSAPDFLS